MARPLIVAVALLALACPDKDIPAPKGGRALAQAAVAAVRPSPDGAQVAWLEQCAPVVKAAVPRGTGSCDLRAAPLDGGEPATIARGVTTLPHGFGWTPDGTLLALAAYDHAQGRGTLVAWTPGAAPRTLASGVSFHAAAPGGRIGWIAGGTLMLLDGGGAPFAVSGATRVATFEFSPLAGGEVGVLAQREEAAGGDLLAIGAKGVRSIAMRTGEYRFSSRGDYAFTRHAGDGDALAFARPGAAPEALRGGVQSFSFSPSGDAVAFLADVAPGKQPDLWVAALPAGAAPGAPVKLAERVGELRWAQRAPRLAWLQEFDPATRSGALAVGAPGERPVTLAAKVSAYDLAPDGARVAFLEHVLQGGYSVDLKLAHLAAGAEPRVEAIARGVFGFELSPDRETLWFRAGCTADGASCDLLRVAATGGTPEKVAEKVRSFDFDPKRAGRVLVGFARADDAMDLGVWEGGRLARLDAGVKPGSAAFAGGARVVYAVAAKGREGVYVADAK